MSFADPLITRSATIHSLIFFLLATAVMLAAPDSAAAQERPCADPRAPGLTFTKGAALKLNKGCQQQRIAGAKANRGFEFVSISGHVTHQNGVRMAGVTMTLFDVEKGTSRTVVTGETGEYLFADIPYGSRVELSPALEGYEFYPPSVAFEGIASDQIWNFIAVGPPPPPPPPPANQPTLGTSIYYDNEPQLADFGSMLGRDAAGNVYVGGTSFMEEDVYGNTDIVLFKTDANGNRVWIRGFDGSANYKDGLQDMAVDAAGNIYLSGYTYSNADGQTSYDYVTLKYDTDGNLLWTKLYGHAPGMDDTPQSMKIDAEGNVYVGGYSWSPGFYANYATVKYSAAGEQLWARRFVGNYGEILNEVEVDAAGNVYVTGYSNRNSAGGSEDVVTIKYNAAGQQQWLNRYNSPANDTDQGYQLEITAAGDVLVLGESSDFSISTTFIRKIDGVTGTAVWTREFDATNDPKIGELPIHIQLDAAGSIILAGMLFDDFSYNVDGYVAKLDAEAAAVWTKIYDGPSDEDYDGDPKITLDAAGNVFAAFTSEGFANADIQVLKYKPDGVIDWTYRFGNPYLDNDYLTEWDDDHGQASIIVDENGMVHVAGESYIPNQSTDLVSFRLEPVAERRAVPYDFDGDGKADLAVFRPRTGSWWIQNSSDGTYKEINWGISTDRIVPADYDGDGKYDPAIYRSGTWWIKRSGDRGSAIKMFGAEGDRPAPSDFDNDGKADLVVFRNGGWHTLSSATDQYSIDQFGLAGDVPIASDFDSNRRSDTAVFRSGSWFVRYQSELPLTAMQFGIAEDETVAADYDGDKKTDFAVYRAGVWYIWRTTSGAMTVSQFGLPGDIPAAADYDGDKKADIAVYRAGVWYIQRSTDGLTEVHQFGLDGDRPAASAYSNKR